MSAEPKKKDYGQLYVAGPYRNGLFCYGVDHPSGKRVEVSISRTGKSIRLWVDGNEAIIDGYEVAP